MIAPDFTVLDVEGHPFRLSEEVSRKPVLLLFWSVFCDPCRAEMATLQKAHDKYAGRDLTVVAVAVDGEPLRNIIGGFARQEGYTFKVLVDELDATESVEGRRRVRCGGDADPSAAGKRREGVAPEGGEDPGGRAREGGFLPPEKMKGREPNPR